MPETPPTPNISSFAENLARDLSTQIQEQSNELLPWSELEYWYLLLSPTEKEFINSNWLVYIWSFSSTKLISPKQSCLMFSKELLQYWLRCVDGVELLFGLAIGFLRCLRSMTFLGDARDYLLWKIYLRFITTDPACSYIISSWLFLSGVECSKQFSRAFSIITYVSGPIFPRTQPNPMHRFVLFLLADFSLDSTFLLAETEPRSLKEFVAINRYQFIRRNNASNQ